MTEEGYVYKATEIAEKLGNPKVMNIVLLGALTKAIDLPEIDWQKIMEKNIKPEFQKINSLAFEGTWGPSPYL